jgi:CD2 antigen cytoplasmic tail-binding protein 2
MSSKRNATGQSSAPKRARFESPSQLETAATDFFEDDVGNQSKRAKEKRTLVGKEGYDSDSTDDGEGVVPSRKTAHGEDEDDDMFGGVAEAQEATSSKDAIADAQKKGFMNLDDIEGQDFQHSKDDDSDYDSEEEARKQAEAQGLDGPMGYAMTGFNMKTELGEGKMTADGENFVMNDKDQGEQYDKWLDGVDREAMKKARKAHREQERTQKARQEKEDRESTGQARKDREAAIMRGMVELLERGETVLEGLQRLGQDVEKKSQAVASSSGQKKKSWVERQRERKALLEGQTAGNDMHVE